MVFTEKVVSKSFFNIGLLGVEVWLISQPCVKNGKIGVGKQKIVLIKLKKIFY